MMEVPAPSSDLIVETLHPHHWNLMDVINIKYSYSEDVSDSSISALFINKTDSAKFATTNISELFMEIVPPKTIFSNAKMDIGEIKPMTDALKLMYHVIGTILTQENASIAQLTTTCRLMEPVLLTEIAQADNSSAMVIVCQSP